MSLIRPDVLESKVFPIGTLTPKRQQMSEVKTADRQT